MKLSICIPTHERHALLEERSFPGLLQQTRRPDEVIVADSSNSAETAAIYQKWAERFRPIPLIYVRTQSRSVAGNRWAAFCRASGDIIFFADDDIRFTNTAIAELLSTFEAYPHAVGVGMKYHYEGTPPGRHLSNVVRNWWLGNVPREPNSICPGGTTTAGKPYLDAKPIPVQWFCGGTMSFRREALSGVGPLPGMDNFFALGIGASEDVLLSRQVGLTGPLMLLTQPFAWHPERRIATSTAVALDGWLRGLKDTLTRAHVLRWLASNRSAVMREWIVSITLEYVRTTKAVLMRPFAPAGWLRLLGLLYGALLTLLIWRRITESPREPIAISRRWLFL